MSEKGNDEKRKNVLVLILLASIAIMVMYVESMAFPSLPKIMQSFNLTSNDLPLASWIITIYLIVGCVAIPIFGKLGDIYGKKKMLVIAMIIYCIAVTLTGFSRDISDSIYVMIGFRAFQGLGMTMFPLAFSIIRDEFPRDQIAVAQGVISAMFGVGTAVGFVAGGFVTDNWGWQWTYHTVIPFAILATVAVYLKVRESPIRLKAKVDYVGAGLLGSTLLLFLVGVTEGENRSFTDPFILALLALSFISLVAFVIWQGKAKFPLVRLTLMKERDIALTNIIAFMIGFALFTSFQVVSIIAGFNFGLNATQIGLMNLPMSALSLIMGPTAGFIVKRTGPKYPLVFGMLVSIAAFISLFLYHQNQAEVVMGILIMGFGNTFAMVGSINMVIISTPREETGISTAVNMIIRTSGSVVGPAIATVIIAGNQIILPGGISVPNDNAYHIIFTLSAIFMLIGVIAALLLTNKKAVGEGVAINVKKKMELAE